MKRAPTLPVHCEKFLSKTYQMSLEQQGALFRLMMITWMNKGQPLADDPDEIAGYLTCTKDRWLNKIRPKLLPLFDLSEGTWQLVEPINLGEEWAYVQNSLRVKSENGSKGGRPPARKWEENSQNHAAVSAQQIGETESPNSLINNISAEAVGSVSVPVSLSTLTETVKEESKNPPLSPPMGGPANGVLFPAQEVQHAPSKPTKQKKPRGSRSKPMPVPEEIFQAYWVLRPPADVESHHNETAARNNFAKAVQSGVDPEEMIQAYANYREEAKYKGKFGTEYVKSAQRFIALDERRWEKHLTPFVPPKTNNVHQLRANGTTGAPMPTPRPGMQF